MTAQVNLEDVKVMYVESPTGVAGAKKAFDELEAPLTDLKGRRFYATFQYPSGPYRACVKVEPSDDPAALGLRTWTIPGGKYARARLENWTGHTEEIPGIFEALAAENDPDPSRPTIEFYRSQKELLLFLPVR